MGAPDTPSALAEFSSHPCVEAHRCEVDEARRLWRRSIEDLEDPARYFGPDVDRDLHPGERYYRLTADRQPIGLGWVRRFTKAGHIRSFGLSLYREARGRDLAVPAGRAIISAVFQEFSETHCLLALTYSTNPNERRSRLGYVGEVREATPDGGSLYISQMTRSDWRAADSASRNVVYIAAPPPAGELRATWAYT